MLANSSSNQVDTIEPADKKQRGCRWWLVIALPAWVFVSFIFAQVFVVALLSGLRGVGVEFTSINTSVLETVAAACVYLLTFGIIVGLPWLVRRYRTTRTDVGLTRLPSWMDIGLAPAGFIVYLLASGLTMYILTKVVLGFDAAEPQEIGFQDLSQRYEYVLAFLTLVVIAPVAEEAIFRGYLYGKLRKYGPIWLSVAVTSLLFGLLHMKWDGGLLAGINVGIDVFVLSVIMCSLREVTGSIWAGILLHMLKNGLAFYLLFINTALLSTIGG
jgi:membrane protease YdiL (CAAX protease family)